MTGWEATRGASDLRALRAVRRWAEAAPEARLTREAKASLERLAKRAAAKP